MKVQDRRIGWVVRTMSRPRTPSHRLMAGMPVEWPQHSVIWNGTVFDPHTLYVSAAVLMQDRRVL